MLCIETTKIGTSNGLWFSKTIGGCLILLGILVCFNAPFGLANGLPKFNQQVFTTANGLCNSNIRVITKDKTGYVWIGTANGLSRFDGHYFSNFFHTPGDTNTLGHNFIQGIICDKAGNIWILHVLGLSLFHPETQYFTNYPIRQDHPNFSGGFSSFAEDFDGNIWVGNQNGLAVFNTHLRRYLNPEQLSKFLFQFETGFAGTSINGIAKGEKGQIWFNTYNRVFIRDPVQKKTLEIYDLPAPELINGLAINYVDTISGILYLGTFNKGLILYHYHTRKWEQFTTGPESLSTPKYDPVRSLQPYRNDLDAYISELGIGFFNKRASKIIPLQPVPFSNDRVMLCLLADSGNLWAGTDNGLFLLTRETIKPENITPSNRNPGAFNTVQVHPYESTIVTGNYGKPVVYQMPAAGGTKTDLEGINGHLRYFFKDRKGNEWLSTEDAIYRKRPHKRIWEMIPVEISSKPATGLLPRNFIEDQNGAVWVRIRNAGIWVFDSLKQAFVQFPSPHLPANSIFSGLAYNAATNTIWLSEENTGLYALAVQTAIWEHHPLQLANTLLTPARIVANNNGDIAIADPFNGIGIYHPETKHIRLISQKDGLLSNNISSVDADMHGDFWTYSAEGISKITAKDFSVINYQHASLTKIQEIACGRDGMIYAATAEGLFRIDGTRIEPLKTTGKLLISKVLVMGRPFAFDRNIELEPGLGDIQIQFSYVDLYSGRQPAFEYSFGKETEWKSLEEQNRISFSRLSPGDYTLTIREKHDKDPQQWQSLSWTIAKPMWQRNWFLLAALIVVATGIYYFTQKRISAIREKAALKQKMAETEMAALRAQMNPHFIFNSINCIDAMVQEGDKYNATTYLNKFAKLLRNVLEGSRNLTVSLSSDMETLRLYIELECMRMDERFDWHIHLPDEVAAADIRVPSLIIQPYVENAILHGLRHLTERKGKLEIWVELKNDVLNYRIKDNGVGMSAAKLIQKTQHNSFGLDITRERIESFNLNNPGRVTIRDIINEKGETAGTEVQVDLPIK